MNRKIMFLCVALFSVTLMFGQGISIGGGDDDETCPIRGFVTLSGPSSTTGNFADFTLSSSDPTDDLFINYVSGPFVTGFLVLSNNSSIVSARVYFTQCPNTSISTNVSFNYDQITECIYDFDYYGQSRSRGISVASNPSSLGVGPVTITQGTTGNQPANQFYTFTASAAGADSYNWTVTGGTIVGPTNGATIKVTPTIGACTNLDPLNNKIEVTAVGVNSICGTTSSPTTDSRPVRAPVYVGNIAGDSRVGYYYGDYSGYTSSAYVPNGSLHEYVWSVSGPFQLGGNGLNQVFVFVNTFAGTGYGTLYVYVKNICGQTITKSRMLTIAPGPVIGGGDNDDTIDWEDPNDDFGWVEVKETQAVSTPYDLKLIVPNFEEKDLRIYIYNINGRLIEEINPNTLEVNLDQSKYRNGIYIVKTISNNEKSDTKFQVGN